MPLSHMLPSETSSSAALSDDDSGQNSKFQENESCQRETGASVLSALEISSDQEHDGSSSASGAASSSSASSASPPRSLGMIPLAMLIFYSVSGGPFGIEESVRSAGAFYSILGFLIAPFVFSLPEALMTAELGSAYPEASGGVAWVEEAFGSWAGWMAGYLGWVAGATDNAIYPVLFLDYVLQIWTSGTENVHPMLRFTLLSSLSIGLAYINWLGLKVVGTMSIAICILSMSPFIIMGLIGAFQVDPQRWLERPESNGSDAGWDGDKDTRSDMTYSGILWRPFLNSLFWNLNSFDAAASFAGDVQDPGRVLPVAMFWSILLVVLGYLIPLLSALGATDSSPHDWVDGYLATAASQIGGPWLGAWVVFSAGVSNVALFLAELSADAFQLMGMAERGFVPKIFAQRSRHGTPTYGILLGLLVIIIAGVANLDKLIEMLNFNYSIALLMEYGAFLKLRISKPELPRPWRIPLGTVGCALLFLPPFVAILIILGLATIPTIIFSFCTNLVGIVLYFVYRGSFRAFFCHYSPVNIDTIDQEEENIVPFQDEKSGDEYSTSVPPIC